MRNPAAILLLAGLAGLLGLAAVWIAQLPPAGVYIAGEAPAGQASYMAMRALGLLSLFLLWLQLMVGVGMPLLGGAADRPALAAFHRRTGLLALGAVLAHPALFLWAIAQRTGALQAELLLPWWGRGFYLDSIALGAGALYLLLIGSLAALLRHRRPFAGLWRKVHRVNGAVFVLAAIHCLRIGSETRLVAVAMIIALGAAAVLVAIGARLRPASSPA